MTRAKEDRQKIDEVKDLLLSLKGVKHVFYVEEDMRRGLADIEKRYPSIGPLAIENTGVRECLKSRHVFCIVKDRSFRGPPQPTVVLVDEEGATIGREVLANEMQKKDWGSKTLFLGKGFVIFYNKGKGKGARFILPPVPFKEVEDLTCTCRVLSCSPSTVGDLFLRKKAKLDDDPELASILVGFDLK